MSMPRDDTLNAIVSKLGVEPMTDEEMAPLLSLFSLMISPPDKTVLNHDGTFTHTWSSGGQKPMIETWTTPKDPRLAAAREALAAIVAEALGVLELREETKQELWEAVTSFFRGQEETQEAP